MFFVLTGAALFLFGCTSMPSTTADKVRIGIAWRADTDSEFLTNVQRAIREAGGIPVLLCQVRSADIPYVGTEVDKSVIDPHDYLVQSAADKIKNAGYRRSNAAEAVGDLKAVIFTGGSDVSPTLFAQPVPWHGIAEEQDYNATRDISDYLLMDYCLSRKDISVLGICRGEQVLGIVSGATIVQDIPAYYRQRGIAYDNAHRNIKATPASYRDYAPHPIDIQPDSILSGIVGRSVLNGCPSWHHQMLKSVAGTPLRVTGTTRTADEDTIEVIERTDRPFAVGIQFHPEAALCKRFDNAANAGRFMTYDSALAFFKAIVAAAH